MENAFSFGFAAAGELFTDRTEDSKRLLENFRNGINTIIISPRRWGKTSLVHNASKLAQNKKLKVVNIDVFYCRSDKDFYNQFATEIIKQTSGKWKEWVDNVTEFLSSAKISISAGNVEFSLSLDFSDKKTPEEILNLPQKIAAKNNCKIVVCIDEFQQITEFDEHLTFQKKLRSIWQLQQDVTYCIYGSKKHLLSELFSRQSMPFYKFGDVFFLQKISKENWIKFICSRFTKTGKKISKELAGKICDIVDNHSYYVQQLSWLVWTNTNKIATQESFEKAVNDLLNQNSMLYYHYVEELSKFQINFLKAIDDNVNSEFTKKAVLQKYNLGTSANIKRLKNSLENKELIDISGKTVRFNDPVFRLWFNKTMKDLF
jgi:hypothetical protein